MSDLRKKIEEQRKLRNETIIGLVPDMLDKTISYINDNLESDILKHSMFDNSSEIICIDVPIENESKLKYFTQLDTNFIYNINRHNFELNPILALLTRTEFDTLAKLINKIFPSKDFRVSTEYWDDSCYFMSRYDILDLDRHRWRFYISMRQRKS